MHGLKLIDKLCEAAVSYKQTLQKCFLSYSRFKILQHSTVEVLAVVVSSQLSQPATACRNANVTGLSGVFQKIALFDQVSYVQVILDFILFFNCDVGHHHKILGIRE